ncbi:hypothetical protein KP509_31G039700 [Ceratopteris richardii]|uniref:Uncharacterized protein n=1 Tax=Ceratopteris richardii TaxID=49495 RepID=A0A8T2QYT4_CERRI|nr:hypothetical protein KP509_31G039700 [Ceratopteris richardii]
MIWEASMLFTIFDAYCLSMCMLFFPIFYSDILESTPKRDDLLYLIERRWKWMKRSIHGFASLLHLAFKEPSLFMDSSLLENRDTYLPKILSSNDHDKFLQDFINYNDQRGSVLASSLVWKRDSLMKPLFWWESFGYQMPML